MEAKRNGWVGVLGVKCDPPVNGRRSERQRAKNGAGCCGRWWRLLGWVKIWGSIGFCDKWTYHSSFRSVCEWILVLPLWTLEDSFDDVHFEVKSCGCLCQQRKRRELCGRGFCGRDRDERVGLTGGKGNMGGQVGREKGVSLWILLSVICPCDTGVALSMRWNLHWPGTRIGNQRNLFLHFLRSQRTVPLSRITQWEKGLQHPFSHFCRAFIRKEKITLWTGKHPPAGWNELKPISHYLDGFNPVWLLSSFWTLPFQTPDPSKFWS